MKINFKDIVFYTGISRKEEIHRDVSESFADLMYKKSNGIAALELSRKIYNSEGEADYTEREVEMIRQVSEMCTPQFIEAINNVINKEEQ